MQAGPGGSDVGMFRYTCGVVLWGLAIYTTEKGLLFTTYLSAFQSKQNCILASAILAGRAECRAEGYLAKDHGTRAVMVIII